MSDWLFKTVVTSSLLYQNAQLSSIGQTLDEIYAAQQLDRANEAFLQFAKEKVFLVKKGLEGLRQATSTPPVQAYFHARMVEKFLCTLSIGTATFPNFADKHYYDETLTLLETVRSSSKQSIGRAEADTVDTYIVTEETMPLLQEALRWKRALDLLQRADVQRMHAETKQIGNTGGNIGCAGMLCALPVVVVVCFKILSGNGVEGRLLFVGIVSVFTLIGGFSLNISAATKPSTELKRRLSDAGLWHAYEALPTKSEAEALERYTAITEQLRAAGRKAPNTTADLEAELRSSEVWVQSCRQLLQPPKLHSP